MAVLLSHGTLTYNIQADTLATALASFDAWTDIPNGFCFIILATPAV